jgi:hypothetical protein
MYIINSIFIFFFSSWRKLKFLGSPFELFFGFYKDRFFK